MFFCSQVNESAGSARRAFMKDFLCDAAYLEKSTSGMQSKSHTWVNEYFQLFKESSVAQCTLEMFLNHIGVKGSRSDAWTSSAPTTGPDYASVHVNCATLMSGRPLEISQVHFESATTCTHPFGVKLNYSESRGNNTRSKRGEKWHHFASFFHLLAGFHTV